MKHGRTGGSSARGTMRLLPYWLYHDVDGNGKEKDEKIMKKANKRFRREMMAAERQEKAGKRNYSLGNARIDDEDDEGVMLYAGNGIMVSCSANLFTPAELEALRGNMNG